VGRVVLFRRENQGSLNDHGVKERGRVDIDQQVLALGNGDGFHLEGRDVTAPGLGVGPKGNVSVDEALGGNVTLTVHIDSDAGLIGHVRLVGSDTNNFGIGVLLNVALSVVDRDSAEVAEVGATQVDESATED
jgi:hypothetical protein